MRGLLTAGADGAMLSLHVHVYAVSAYEVVITMVAGPAIQEHSNADGGATVSGLKY